MSIRFLTPLLASFAVAVSLAASPIAAAAPDKSRCSDRGGSSMCQRPGHTSLRAEPRRPNATSPGGQLFNPAFIPGFGGGMAPAIMD